MERSLIVAAMVIVLLLTVLLLGITNGKVPNRVATAVDTIWVTKVVRVADTKAKDSVIVRYAKVTNGRPDSSGLRPSAGTASGNDSVSAVPVPENIVSVPIYQKVYADSSYTAWVSGYMCNLDSLHIKIRSPTVTKESIRTNDSETRNKQKRFGIGLQGGYGMTPKGLQPYVGIGFTYRIF